MTAHVEDVESQMPAIQPVVAESVTTQLCARLKTPIRQHGAARDRYRQQRTHVGRSFRQLIAKALLASLQRLEGTSFLIAQPFPLQGSPDPGTQKDRVERFAHVILRPGFDAAGDVVLLVQRGDDDHGDVSQGRIRLYSGQNLIAVESRHDHIEQPEADLLCPNRWKYSR